jgi:hypothetical protein
MGQGFYNKDWRKGIYQAYYGKPLTTPLFNVLNDRKCTILNLNLNLQKWKSRNKNGTLFTLDPAGKKKYPSP